MFKNRHKLKVYIKGVLTDVIKSKNYDYILKKLSEYKDLYSNTDVEFRLVTSKIEKVKKPRYKEFKNLPEWDNVAYGINSDDQYYLKNLNTDKVIRLHEIN